MSSQRKTHFYSTVIFKAGLVKKIFSLIASCVRQIPVTSTLKRVARLIHLFGHKDQSWLTRRKPMMYKFVRLRLFTVQPVGEPNQKAVISDLETKRASQLPKHILFENLNLRDFQLSENRKKATIFKYHTTRVNSPFL